MRTLISFTIAAMAVPLTASAQGPTRVSRAEAVSAATERGPRLALGRADTMLAAAGLLSAKALPNPTLSAIYTRDVPRYHLTAEIPLDFLTVRGTRVKSAEASQVAARFRFQFGQALLALDADTTYTRALAANAKVALSRRNAEAADSLRRIAAARRDAGDASDLDVDLATVYAGQQANQAAADSVTLASSLLDLQVVMGMAAGAVRITLTDTLAPPLVAVPAAPSGMGGATLPVASATAALNAAELALRLEHRSVFGMPGLMFGFDAGDPTSDTKGVLPTIGIAMPLPIFNRNKGPIAVAQAERDRATAELAVTQVESRAAVARASRQRDGAMAKVTRDRLLVASATRVATMSLEAYREGAVPLASVLEAQRNARDVLANFIDDVADALVADATFRALTLTPRTGNQP